MKLSRILWRMVVPSRGMLRLTAYFTTVALGVSALAGRALYADVREAALSAGHELVGFADLTQDAEAVIVNGVHFHHTSVSTDQPLAAVLDRFEEHCEQNPNFVGRELAKVKDEQFRAGSMPPLSKANRHGVIRSEEGGRGMVMCFVDDKGENDAKTFAGRMQRFVETQDLSEFGAMRYAYGEQEDGKTRIVILWADSGMNVNAMFPASGDAAGSDSNVVPRPPGARRVLSGAAENVPYAVRLYESPEPRDKARAFYDRWMADHGWSAVPLPDEEKGGRVYFDPSGYQVYVGLEQRESGSVVSLVEAGRANGESMTQIRVRGE